MAATTLMYYPRDVTSFSAKEGRDSTEGPLAGEDSKSLGTRYRTGEFAKDSLTITTTTREEIVNA